MEGEIQVTDAAILAAAIAAAEAVNGKVRIPRHLAFKCLRLIEQESTQHDNHDPEISPATRVPRPR